MPMSNLRGRANLYHARKKKAKKLKRLGRQRRKGTDFWSPERKRAKKASGPKKKNPPKVKMRKAPKDWISAKAVRVVTRGGRKIVEVKR